VTVFFLFIAFSIVLWLLSYVERRRCQRELERAGISALRVSSTLASRGLANLPT